MGLNNPRCSSPILALRKRILHISDFDVSVPFLDRSLGVDRLCHTAKHPGTVCQGHLPEAARHPIVENAFRRVRGHTSIV